MFPDGRTGAVRSKASNRCPGCARAAAFEEMTMLRVDAEENDTPTHVLTLTSREPVEDSAAYRRTCENFWRWVRRNYGRSIEYCGFIEWTTGTAPRSGGLRRMHSHWLVKVRDGATLGVEDEAALSAKWRELHGAWRVQLAELNHAGGVVGYLALHHEKVEQGPPSGWTGRRLRPSKGYFAESGARRRARARLWLASHREAQREYPRPYGEVEAPRLVWRSSEGEKGAARLLAEPGNLASLAAFRERDRLLLDPSAPIHADEVTRIAQDWASANRAALRRALRASKLESGAKQGSGRASAGHGGGDEGSDMPDSARGWLGLLGAAPDRPAPTGGVRAAARDPGRRVGGVP